MLNMVMTLLLVGFGEYQEAVEALVFQDSSTGMKAESSLPLKDIKTKVSSLRRFRNSTRGNGAYHSSA